MTIEIGIISDNSLPAILQSVNLLTPWARLPVSSDFSGENKPFIQVPVLSWAVQYRELDIRAKLITYLQGIFPGFSGQINTNISQLPANMVNNVLANIFYNVADLYTYAILPRIDNVFCTSPYAASALWVGYYLSGALQADYAGLTDNESVYRNKQLTDLQVILGYTLRTLISANPGLAPGNAVIIAATESTVQDIVIFCDNARLNTYVNQGGTLNGLCSQWLTQKYNPIINS